MNRSHWGRHPTDSRGDRHPSFEDLWNFRRRVAGPNSQGNWDRDDGGGERSKTSLTVTPKGRFKIRKKSQGNG